MEPTISDAGPFEKVVTFEIVDADLDQAKIRAARKLAKSMKIPGFRPGKAPVRVIEATVGADRLRAEAIDEALPEMVGAALEQANIEPAATPAVESLEDTESGVEVGVRVAVWPALTEAPNYVGREIEVPAVAVTDEEIAEQIDRIRDQFAEIEPSDEPAANGDFVSIDLSAARDGTPVEAMAAEGLMVEVGGNEFIAGLSDVLVGKSATDVATFEGPLPAGFTDESAGAPDEASEQASEQASDEVSDEMAGESSDEESEDAEHGAETDSPEDDESDGGDEHPVSELVEYTVTVQQVHGRKRPVIDDEWVDENTEFETLEEFTEEMRNRLADSKLGASYSAFRNDLLTALTDEIELELPDAIVTAEMEEVLHRFSHTLSEQGIEMADYLRVSGQTEAAFVSDLRESALRNVRTDLVLDAVSDDAGLVVEPEEYDELILAVAGQNGQTVDEVKASLTENQEKKLRSDILRRKAHDALMKAAVPVDEAGTPIDFETLASELASTEDVQQPDADLEAEAVEEEHE